MQEPVQPSTGLRPLPAPPAPVHMVGICGAGMSGLARLLAARGYRVTGCDAAPNPLADWLQAAGITARPRHDPAHVADADWVIRTPAVPADAPEIRAAAARGLPLYVRGEVLPVLLNDGPSVAVAGTHGKTTTTAFVAQLLRTAGRALAWCIGGEVPGLPGPAGRLPGTGDAVLVAESDESDGTLAFYRPLVGLVTNIEFDHMEHFADEQAFFACFDRFAAQARHALVVNLDDPGSRALAGRTGAHVVTFGFGPEADLSAEAITAGATGSTFVLRHRDRRSAPVTLPWTGRHNIANLLAALAALAALGLDPLAVVPAIPGLQLPRRRCDVLACSGARKVVSDYAHHPSEIRAMLQGIRQAGYTRIQALFQPHRYTRTRMLGADFPPAFDGLEELILAPVYAASEPVQPGGTAADLYARFRAHEQAHPDRACRCVLAGSLAAAAAHMTRRLGNHDLSLVVGAGDVERVAHALARHLAAHPDPGPDALTAGEAALWEELRGDAALGLQRGRALGALTTFGMGGSAALWAEPDDAGALARLLVCAGRHGVPCRVLGGGSNVLAGDLVLPGVTLRLGAGFRRIEPVGDRLRVGAGVTVSALLDWLAAHDLGGLEFLEGIPGTVGGLLRMNAGAHGGSFGDHVVRVQALRRDGTAQDMEPAVLGFAYRSCPGLKGLFAVAAEIQVAARPRADALAERQRYAAARAWMKGLRTAGSVFKNPPGDYAGRLIEVAGMKGFRVGGACVSERHGNVIVADRVDGRASDISCLIALVKQRVQEQHGVTLEEEIESWVQDDSTASPC